MNLHILGKGRGWELAPTTGEVWGINDIILRRGNLTKLFHMHDLRDMLNHRKQKDSIKIATRLNIPIVTTKLYPSFAPSSVEYPLKDIIKKFKIDYFSNSVSYMLAYALYKKDELNLTDIYLYGINMAREDEYLEQRPCLEFWLGICHGMGINYHITGNFSNVCRTENCLRYGYNEVQQFTGELLKEG